MKREFVIVVALVNLILLAASIIVNLITFFGIDVLAKFPIVWSLHIGIFLVCIPIMILHSRETGTFGRINYSIAIKFAPQWMKVLLTVLGFYAVITFGLDIILTEGGGPDIWDGRYVLHSHGELIRELTIEEYNKQMIYLVRTFSVIWIILYSNTMVAYYSYLNNEEVS